MDPFEPTRSVAQDGPVRPSVTHHVLSGLVTVAVPAHLAGVDYTVAVRFDPRNACDGGAPVDVTLEPEPPLPAMNGVLYDAGLTLWDLAGSAERRRDLPTAGLYRDAYWRLSDYRDDYLSAMAEDMAPAPSRMYTNASQRLSLVR